MRPPPTCDLDGSVRSILETLPITDVMERSCAKHRTNIRESLETECHVKRRVGACVFSFDAAAPPPLDKGDQCSHELERIARQEDSAAQRTISLDVAALTGKSQHIARAALDVVGEDRERAFALLMSEMEVTVLGDDPPVELEPFLVGSHAWLGDEGAIVSTGSFGGFTLPRLPRDFRGDLRLFTLEPLQVCLLAASPDPIAPGWEVSPTGIPPEIQSMDERMIFMQYRTFNPGLIAVPLEDAQLPLCRVLKQQGVKRCRNSLRRSVSVTSQCGDVSVCSRIEAPVAGGDICTLEATDPPCAINGVVPSDPATSSSSPRANAQLPKFTIIKEIGSGAFGEVFLADTFTDGQPSGHVAVKRCHVHAQEGRNYRREFELLRKISHPCIVRLVGFSVEDVAEDGRHVGRSKKERCKGGGKQVQIVMEYLPDTLHARIGHRALVPSDVRIFTFQLLRALAHLDTLRICHRDVKPENVLLDGWRLKLADFGSAKELGEGPNESYICSRWWRAPELILGTSEYSTCVDWWSCGCVIGEMMIGKPLFDGNSNWGQMYSIIDILGTPSQEEVEALSPSARMLRHLKKLAEFRRTGIPWREVMPAMAAAAPEMLELLPRLLAYAPAARRTPAELLLSRPLAAVATEAPAGLLDFSSEELSSYPPRVRRGLHELAGRARRRQLVSPREPAGLVPIPDVSEAVPSAISAECAGAKRTVNGGAIETERGRALRYLALLPPEDEEEDSDSAARVRKKRPLIRTSLRSPHAHAHSAMKVTSAKADSSIVESPHGAALQVTPCRQLGAFPRPSTPRAATPGSETDL